MGVSTLRVPEPIVTIIIIRNASRPGDIVGALQETDMADDGPESEFEGDGQKSRWRLLFP